MSQNKWYDGMMGLVVGDALGLPVQFLSREQIRNREKGPVTGMESGGAYRTPKGMWSDDSSLALASLDVIIKEGKPDPLQTMYSFLDWVEKGAYTPRGYAFDLGRTCDRALQEFVLHSDPETCGQTEEYSNGNGSLMSILPACLYYAGIQTAEKKRNIRITNDEIISKIHEMSGLTHAHMRSKMACGFYYFCVKQLLFACDEENPIYNDMSTGRKISLAVAMGLEEARLYYDKKGKEAQIELNHFRRLWASYQFAKLDEDEIRSSGYVIDTLEAAIWCLLTTESYEECLLKAVNLGHDTDTVGAVVGGLAGIIYGVENIPEDWINVILRRNWIEYLCLQANQLGKEPLHVDDFPLADIHSHLIPGADDGSASMEMSMQMIDDAYRQGARIIFCTPHDTAFSYYKKEVMDSFNQLKSNAREKYPNLKLYLGSEVYVEADFISQVIEDLDSGLIPTLNGTKYVLIEFREEEEDLNQMKVCVRELVAAGYIPIIAHAERCYPALAGTADGKEFHLEKIIQNVRDLREMGALIQANYYSVMEEHSLPLRRMAGILIANKMVDFLGSDAHRTTYRPPYLLGGVIGMGQLALTKNIREVCYENAKTLLTGK